MPHVKFFSQFLKQRFSPSRQNNVHPPSRKSPRKFGANA
jgi:hypothetical protein